MTDAWNPDTYRRFASERAQPFWDLVDLAEPLLAGRAPARAVDLGCGDAELTEAAFDRWGALDREGIDASPAMVSAARAGGRRVDVRAGDIAPWSSEREHDVVLANASLQWVPDHPGVLQRWCSALAPGGVLAVQVPANSDGPAHLVADRVAHSEPFVSALGGTPPSDPVAVNVLAPEEYARVLLDAGLDDVNVRLQVYVHHLPSSRAVVDWVRGTTLTRFARRLDDDTFARYLDAYRDALLAEIGDVAPFTFLFKRILMVGRYGSAT